MNVGPCMCRHGTAMYVWMGLRCLLLVRLFCGQFSLLESRVLLTSFRIEFCQPSFSVGVFSLVYFYWRKDNNCLIHQCFVVQQSFQYTHTQTVHMVRRKISFFLWSTKKCHSIQVAQEVKWKFLYHFSSGLFILPNKRVAVYVLSVNIQKLEDPIGKTNQLHGSIEFNLAEKRK